MVLRSTWAYSGPESSLDELEFELELLAEDFEAFCFEPEFTFWAESGSDSLLGSEDFEEALFDDNVRLPSRLDCAGICLILDIGSLESS